MIETEGELVFGGFVNVPDKFVQPTVFCDVPECDILMQHEVSGRYESELFTAGYRN